MTAQRIQLASDDVADTERLRKVLNDALLSLQARLEALEAVKGVTVLEDVTFETGAAVSPTDAPFSMSAGGLKVACGFTPTGLVLLRVENLTSSAVSTATHEVHWHFAAGSGPAEGTLHIDYVTGLATATRYRMRLGVTRE